MTHESSKGTWVGKRAVAAVVLLTVGALLSACSSNPAAPTTSTITIAGAVPPVGQTSQLTATATLSNGTSQNVTTQATWSSSNPAVATITAGGLLTVVSLAFGSATITAIYQSQSGILTVAGVAITSVSIAGPASLIIPQPAQFTATARFADGTSQDVTALATWASTVPTNDPWFNVSPVGLVTPLETLQNPFSMQPVPAVTAMYQGKTGTAVVSIVLPCQLTGLTGSLPGGAVLAPGVLSFAPPATGGTYSVSVQAPSNCAWTAIADDNSPATGVVPSSFATVTAGGSGMGNGVISFSLAPNFPPGALRIIPLGAGANALNISFFGIVEW
jgi:hypothetical protein